MWIASKFGFFSIVNKNGKFHIRARKREDLENLCILWGINTDRISVSQDADYRFRVIINGFDDILNLFEMFADSIDYPNFKTEISTGRFEQKDKLSIYSRLWRDFHAYQARNEESEQFNDELNNKN